MNQKQEQGKFEKLSFQILLDSVGEEPVQIEAGAWRGVEHIGIRQLFRGQDGRLFYGKQGFNIPVGDFKHAMIALMQCYNDATGEALNLIDEAADDDSTVSAIYEAVDEEMKAEMEPVYAWKREG